MVAILVHKPGRHYAQNCCPCSRTPVCSSSPCSQQYMRRTPLCLLSFSVACQAQQSWDTALEAFVSEQASAGSREALEGWNERLSDLRRANAATLSPTSDPVASHPCPGGQLWDECGSPCTRTCELMETVCSTKCMPRCQCPSHKPIWTGFECVEAAACSPPSPPPFGLTDAGCASCGCSVQYGAASRHETYERPRAARGREMQRA